MPILIPAVEAEPILPGLQELFRRAGADWQHVRNDRPLEPKVCPTGDGWLARAWRPLVVRLSEELAVGRRERSALMDALERARLRTPGVADSTPILFQTGNVKKKAVEREQAGAIIFEYLRPLLNPITYRLWLNQMARTQFFWRGGQPESPRVPYEVAKRESARDAELLESWLGQPPTPPRLDPTASRESQRQAQREYERALDRYKRQQASARSYLQSEPAAPGLSEPEGLSRAERRQIEAWRRTASTQFLPLVVIGDGPAPANLYISEVAAPLSAYLDILEPVIRFGANSFVWTGPLVGVAYAMLALALVPVFCLYDRYHGTCTIERLLPLLNLSLETARTYPLGDMRNLLMADLERRFLDLDSRQRTGAENVLRAFSRWASSLVEETRRAHDRLLKLAAEQSGGRLRTPTQFSTARRWEFHVQLKKDDDSTETLELSTPEFLAYETARDESGNQISRREHADFSEIFWLLRAVWEPVATAEALINQAGFTFWINAANNRWGGNHPPHSTHRQGNSLDIDVGFSWRPRHKVHNVKKRRPGGFPISEADFPKNKEFADCLHRMERIAGWVGVQAFMLIGVSQYLYGDFALVDEAFNHLSSHFELVRPIRLQAVFDPSGHNDHWHFEVLVGPRPGTGNGYFWQAAVADLFSELYRLGKERDANLSFWQKMAGLNKVPDKPEDFDELPDADDWKAWWALRTPEGGLPLLPIWAPEVAKDTFNANECMEPRRVEPRVTEPGTTGA